MIKLNQHYENASNSSYSPPCFTPASPSIPAQSNATPSQQQAQDTTGNLIIFYDAQTGSAPLLKAVKASGASLIYEYKNLNGIAIRPSSKTKI